MFAPGYSYLFLPNQVDGQDSPSGVTFGLGLGAAFRVAPKVSLTAELGYQFGFQSTTIAGVDVDLKTNFLHLAGGILVDL
jgi:outer membrane autotransporter protein